MYHAQEIIQGGHREVGHDVGAGDPGPGIGVHPKHRLYIDSDVRQPLGFDLRLVRLVSRAHVQEPARFLLAQDTMTKEPGRDAVAVYNLHGTRWASVNPLCGAPWIAPLVGCCFVRTASPGEVVAFAPALYVESSEWIPQARILLILTPPPSDIGL